MGKKEVYTVFGVQYLPDRSHARGEHLKHTLQRMSKRRSKSETNFRARLGLEPKTGKSIQNGHAHSVPEMHVDSLENKKSDLTSENTSDIHGSDGKVHFTLELDTSCKTTSEPAGSPVSANGRIETGRGCDDVDVDLSIQPDTLSTNTLTDTETAHKPSTKCMHLMDNIDDSINQNNCKSTDNPCLNSSLSDIVSQTGDDPSGIELSAENWQNYPFPYENVVLSGGGSKGYAYIGALKALEDCGVLSRVRRIGGSSAGAICGGLLAVGCSPQEIADVFFCNIKWLFQDQTCGCCFCLPKIWKSYGINPGVRLMEIYGNHIAKKVGNRDITFMELYRDYGREFCVVVTNLSRMCSEYCHWTTTPDLPIRRAVRMSMAFPVVYEPVKGNLFGEEHLYMDGGTLDQFPIHCFDGPLLELNHNLETGQKRCSNHKTIGICLVSEDPIDHKIWDSLFGEELPNKPAYLPHTKLARSRLKEEKRKKYRLDKSFDSVKYVEQLKADRVIINGKEQMQHFDLSDKSRLDIVNFSHYFKASVSTVIVSQRRLHVKPADIHRTVALNCGYIRTNDYALEPQDREFMIRCGYDNTKKFLQDYIKCQKTGRGTLSDSNHEAKMPRSVSAYYNPTRTMLNLPRSASTVSRTSRETQV